MISKLRQQLSNGPPIPKVDPQPTGGEPIPPLPQDPHPLLPGRVVPVNPNGMDLGALAPKQLTDFLECCSTVLLKKLLSLETAKLGKEQDASVISKLYREIKKR